MRIWWLLLLTGLLIAVGTAHAAEWEMHALGGVRVHVKVGEEALARQIGAMAEEELPRISAVIGVVRPKTFDVYAYTDRATFLRETTREPFTLGVSYSPSGTIRLDANDTTTRVRNTLAHELTHSLISQRLRGDLTGLPTWVNEGIAGQLSEPVRRDELRNVAKLMHREGILTLPELENAFDTGRYRDAAYLQSRSMVAWLEDRHPEAVTRIFARMSETNDHFYQALPAITGLTHEQWLREWARSVPDIMFWLLLLNSPVVYAPLALILVILIVLRLRRRRDEEDEEAKPQPRNDRRDDDADEDEDLEDLLPE
ncbi:MAG: hypothetical protein BWY76_02013 [bacterium ADurb.Bin429]|nr:MAG: hypothetical protein BWY76_02013 [bacterium ADurb.Bin429]